MTLRTLNYGNYGIFLIMGNAGFCPSAVVSELKGSRVWVLIQAFSLKGHRLNDCPVSWNLTETYSFAFFSYRVPTGVTV